MTNAVQAITRSLDTLSDEELLQVHAAIDDKLCHPLTPREEREVEATLRERAGAPDQQFREVDDEFWAELRLDADEIIRNSTRNA